jgi:hypothetical protein
VRDDPAVNSLPKRLAKEGPFNCTGLDQIKNGSQGSREFVTGPCLYITSGQVRVVKHHNSWHPTAAPELSWDSHVEFCRIQV